MTLREKILRHLRKSKRNCITVTEASEKFGATRQAAYLALLKLLESREVRPAGSTAERVGRPATIWVAR